MARVYVAPLSPPEGAWPAAGEGRRVDLGRRSLAFFVVDGRLHAIDDACPHRGESLARGFVEDCAVECPAHGWRFSLLSGAMLESTRVAVSTYAVEVAEDGGVWVELPD
jgi:3-phenylpropionate/trans-cinnamate dioxygenase ferredoxin subunit